MTNKNKMEKQSEKFIWIFFCGFANGYLPYRLAIICGRVTCDCLGLGAEPWNPEKNDNHSYHLLPVTHFLAKEQNGSQNRHAQAGAVENTKFPDPLPSVT